jgi:hypothetical protein
MYTGNMTRPKAERSELCSASPAMTGVPGNNYELGERVQLCRILVSDFWPPEQQDSKSYKDSPSLWYFVTADQGK